MEIFKSLSFQLLILLIKIRVMSALFINNFALFIVATYKLPYHLLEPHELKYTKLFEYFLIFLVLYLAAMFFI